MKYLPFVLLTITGVTWAEEGHREHSAHMHGHARMTMVLSGNELEIEIDTPAMNLLSFEHRATSSNDKKKLSDTIKFLNSPSNWISIDKKARCNLENILVESDLLENDDHGHEHEHEDKQSSHSDFKIAAKYTCSHAQKLKSVSFSGLFNNFKGLAEIDAKWLTDYIQSATELDTHNTEILLK